MVDLGTLAGRVNSYPGGLNDAGQVVGRSTTSTGASHAFVWTQSGGMVDLGTLGGTSSTSPAVNDSGQVVGSSTPAATPPTCVLVDQGGWSTSARSAAPPAAPTRSTRRPGRRQQRDGRRSGARFAVDACHSTQPADNGDRNRR